MGKVLAPTEAGKATALPPKAVLGWEAEGMCPVRSGIAGMLKLAVPPAINVRVLDKDNGEKTCGAETLLDADAKCTHMPEEAGAQQKQHAWWSCLYNHPCRQEP